MKTTMVHFEHEDCMVLGFDTGLSERAFAQAKAAALVTESGYIVSKDASINMWKPEGAAEIDKRMVIWGPDFEGVPLDRLLQNDDKDMALDALRSWLLAVKILSDKNIFPLSSPKGAIIAHNGDIFFPPSALIKRTLDAEGKEAALSSLQYLHPNLAGGEALIFSAGTMLYQIFSGNAAFQGSSSEEVRSNIQKGKCIPINLASPGLDEKTVRLINSAIKQEDEAKPSLNDVIDAIGSKGAKRYADFFTPLSDDEKKSIIIKREQFQKRDEMKAKAKRFFHKNKTIIMGAGIGAVIIIAVAWSIIAGIQSKPGTNGMSPYEIAQQYYASFGTMNHDFMEAATRGKAGKEDVSMVQNLFVISKVRQAYEMIAPVMSAEEWILQGSPETETTIFGVTNLELTEIDQSENEATFEAKYLLWMPATFLNNDDAMESADPAAIPVSALPVSIMYSSELKFTKRNDAWYITNITKQE